MTSWLESPLRTLSDVERFESELPLQQRLPGDSVFDVFVRAATHGDRIALTRVAVTLADSDTNDAPQLQAVLDGYLFQATVET